MEKLIRQLTLRYFFIQGSYWIAQCAIYSFAAVYLQSKNFNNTQIGLVLSIASISSIILQAIVSSFLDRTKRISLRSFVLVLMSLVLGLGILLFLLPSSFLFIAFAFVSINAIQITLNPLYNSLALEYMNQGISMNYGLARGGGSIAFAVMSSALGIMVKNFGPKTIIITFILGHILTMLATYFFKINIPDDLKESIPKKMTDSGELSTNGTEKPTSIFSFFITYKRFTLFLVGVAMIFYAHSLINTYLINIMENVGGNSSDMGLSLSIAATLELPTMAVFILLVRKIKCSNLIKISAFFFFIKTLLTWLASSVFMVHLAMSLQVFSFALFMPAAIYYVNNVIHEKDRVKGQSMLGAAYLGISGTLASISGGRILDKFDVSLMLLVGTLVTAIGVIIIFISAKEKAD